MDKLAEVINLAEWKAKRQQTANRLAHFVMTADKDFIKAVPEYVTLGMFEPLPKEGTTPQLGAMPRVIKAPPKDPK